MLIAGQIWRAAVLICGALSRTLLTAVPPRRAARPGGSAVLPARLHTLKVDRRNLAGVPSTGVTTLARQVDPRGFPVDATVISDKNGDYVEQIQLFVRVADLTKVLDDDEKQTYLAQHWPGAA